MQMIIAAICALALGALVFAFGLALCGATCGLRLGLAAAATCLAVFALIVGGPPLKPSLESLGGTALNYRIEPRQDGDKAASADEVAERMQVILENIDAGYIVRVQGEHELQVVVAGGEDQVEFCKSLLAGVSGDALELRIVARPGSDDETIALAEQAAVGETVLFEGNPVARWYPIKEGVLDDEMASRHAALRKDGQDRFVLLLLNPNDVNGGHLASVRRGTDSTFHPMVEFTTTEEGAQRLEYTTSLNLPDSNGVRRQLAIVFQGRVVTAPVIQSTITDRGQITGNFTKAEVEEMVGVLRTGGLPASLTLESEIHVGADLSFANTVAQSIGAFAAMAIAMLIAGAAVYRIVALACAPACAMQLALILGVAAPLHVAFTLPALFAIAIPVGVGIGSPLLIGALIRAHRKNGLAPAPAVQEGFHDSVAPIVVVHVVLAMCGACLCLLGLEPMRTFGFFLFVGGVSGLFSLFTAARGALQVVERRMPDRRTGWLGWLFPGSGAQVIVAESQP